jgi:hypothetical protein
LRLNIQVKIIKKSHTASPYASSPDIKNEMIALRNDTVWLNA